MMMLLVHVVYAIVLCQVAHVAGQAQVGNMATDCQRVTNGVTVYVPCSGESVHLLHTHTFGEELEPPNATCGEPSAPYAENMQGRWQTFYCNSTTSQGMGNMYDLASPQMANMDTCWQSWTWDRGNPEGTARYPTPMEVNITFHFNKTYELKQDIALIFRNSRPRKMILEKSDDFGVTFEPWQYNAYSCLDDFGLASNLEFTDRAPETVICVEKHHDLPYNDAQVTFSAMQRFMLFLGDDMANRQALAEAYENTQLFPFLRFTDFRIRLLQPAGSSSDNTEIDLLASYYSICNVDVIAGCFCNLHGSICEDVPGTNGQQQCKCEHNTEGKDCERCLPLYNNRPWRPGSLLPYATGGTANECQRCECNDHADSCTYDSGLNKGVCNDCYHNTMGDDCKMCIPGYYKNSSVAWNDPNACVHCQCEPLGVVANSTECASPSGQCTCRENIGGLMCNICDDEYYGLLEVEPIGECKECGCNLDGTQSARTGNICEKQLGQCPCKMSVTGRICDQCAPGYYQFPTGRPQDECQQCGCNPGGAVSQTCDSSSGRCVCHEGIQGTKCSVVTPGFYIPAPDAVAAQPASGSCVPDTDIPSAAHPFSGSNFYTCAESQNVVFAPINGAELSRMPLQWTGYPVMRYNLAGNLPWGMLTILLRVSDSSVDLSTYQTNYNTTVDSNSCPGGEQNFIVTNITAGMGRYWTTETNMTFDIRCTYSFSVIVGAPGFNSSDRVLEIDSMVLAPDITTSLVYQQADASTQGDYQDCWHDIMSLTSRDTALNPADCRALTFGMMGDLFAGALPCQCSAVGTTGATLTTCGDLGGQCTCKTGVFMRQCTTCKPGYYNYTTNGCINCQCAALGSTVRVCDYNTGQCPCRTDVARNGELNTLGLSDDLRCRGCKANYFGYSTGTGCQQCLCDEIGANSTQCDDSGVCVCNPTFNGDKCSVCEPGYYNFVAGGCTRCNCHPTGSLGVECNAMNGQCECRQNVMSLLCDVCKVGYFNLQEKNPDGCQPCFCYGHGDACDDARGYRPLLITAASVTTWVVSTPTIAVVENSVRDYYTSPSPFPGDRVFAYAQYLTATIEPTNSMALYLQNYMPVILEGNGGKQIFYGAPNTSAPLAFGSPTTVQFLLHENYWYINATHNPDPFDMQVILQQLEAIYIAKQLGSISVTVTDVILTTAEPGPSPTPVTYVESCSCTMNDHVAGPFCDICAQGFYRQTLNGSSYETCQACNCNSNSATEPTPICNEGDGVCLNCRDGTTGDHCELCSANVIQPECTECVNEFWNISQTGCQPCECDPVGSSNMQCDKVSGQCVCRDTTGNTITGRQCNECIDNYYNLQQSGCTACDSVDDTCYTLVFNEMVILRQKRDNLTEYTTYLMQNDNNTALGPFYDRMQDMLKTMENLLEFLGQAKNAESTVGVEIARLNTSLTNLREIQDIDIQSSIHVANTSIQAADTVLLTAQNVRLTTENTARQANGVLTGGLDGTLTVIDSQLTALQGLEQDLRQIGGTATEEAGTLLDVVQGIEDTARHASAKAEEAIAITTEANSLYDQSHVDITTLATNVDSTSAASTNLEEEARNTTIAAEAVRAGVQAIQQDLNNMEALSYDPDAMEQQAGQFIAQAAVLQEQSENATGANSYITGEVDIVLANTSALMVQVASVRGDGEALMARINTAYTTAMDAKTTEQQVFTNASNMLNVMQNFDTLYTRVKTEADAALAQVQGVQTLAETAIANANNIQTQLQPVRDDSQEAKDIATYTAAGANDILTQLANLSADQLSNEAAPLLNDVSQRLSQIVVANQTRVMPAANTCNMFAASLDTLETNSAASLALAQQTLAAVEDTQSRDASLLTQVNNIQQLNVGQIEALRQQVTQLRSAFDQSQLAETIARLKATKETQNVQLAALKAQKDTLAAKVARLKFVRDQLRRP